MRAVCGSASCCRRSTRFRNGPNDYSVTFAQQMTKVFDGDLKLSTPYTLQGWQIRSWMQRVAEVILIPIKAQLQGAGILGGVLRPIKLLRAINRAAARGNLQVWHKARTGRWLIETHSVATNKFTSWFRCPKTTRHQLVYLSI